MINTVINWDCLEIMKSIPDGSIDCIITDPPYWTTACKWDSVIPFDLMWAELKRIIKPNWAIVLFGSEPFSSALRMSNIKQYKYDWIWNKKLAWNWILAKKQPLKIHELVHIFNSNIYYPQKTKWKMRSKMFNWNIQPKHLNKVTDCKETFNDEYYPQSIQEFTIANLRRNRLHPTQKPVALIEYLIKTYTNEWETVLDFTSWSGTTWIAAQNTNRNYILIEKDEWYYNISKERLVKNKILLWSA